jgi:thiol-disulfide isomerase/thioredoxin
MSKAPVGTGLVAGCLLLCGSAALAGDLPSVQTMLSFRPRVDGVALSTPTAQEEGACKVESVKGTGQGAGYLLRDPQGRPLRRFYNTRFTNVKDGTKIDVWSYYKDGVEVYREWAGKNGDSPDQFRWMNGGGTKWGSGTVDSNNQARIDSWKMISAEEASQEALLAVATHNLNRLQALLITDAEVQSLGLPATEVNRIQELRKQAPVKFQETVAKLSGLSDKTHWLHLETTPPQCLPADLTGAPRDIIRFANTTVLCETGGKNDWLQTGEMIQIGQTWRLTGAAAAGLQDPMATDAGPDIVDKELQPLLEELRKLDDDAPRGGANAPSAAIVRYNLQRADVLEKIVQQAAPEKRDPWIRQVADCLSAAAQATPPGGDKTASRRLQSLEEQIVKGMPPGSSLAGYIAFREMAADYAVRLNEKGDLAKTQEQWLERLGKFVQTYPKADDTPDALLQLGMVSEFVNKEVQAKNWYQQLVTNFADKPQAAKARGAIDRLELEGKALKLSAPTLSGSQFDIAHAQGKLVVVYYWASWNHECLGDFAKLKLLLDKYGSQGLELVTVNLDTSAEEANTFLRQSPAPGTHLYQPGGLDNSPLATQYGIMGLPNLFLVGKDGKVLSRTVQISNLEDEIKKQVK